MMSNQEPIEKPSFPFEVLPGVGIALGAGTGTALGVALAGGPGIAVGAGIGAVLGLLIGAIIRTMGRDRQV